MARSYGPYRSPPTFEASLLDGAGARHRYNKKLAVWNKTGGWCWHCGCALKFSTCMAGDGAEFHCDHLIPKSRGGSNRTENLVPACAYCNYSKWNLNDWVVESRGKRGCRANAS